MRVMIKFEFPTDSGNAIVGSGKINDIFQKVMEDFQPEAAYFFPSNGQRGGVLFVNMQDSSEVALKAERLWIALGAKVEMTPVMAVDDLMKGLAEIPGIVERFS